MCPHEPLDKLSWMKNNFLFFSWRTIFSSCRTFSCSSSLARPSCALVGGVLAGCSVLSGCSVLFSSSRKKLGFFFTYTSHEAILPVNLPLTVDSGINWLWDSQWHWALLWASWALICFVGLSSSCGSVQSSSWKFLSYVSMGWKTAVLRLRKEACHTGYRMYMCSELCLYMPWRVT